MVKDVFCGKNSATTALVNCHFADYLAQVFENYLARRAAMPISPQRRTLAIWPFARPSASTVVSA